MEPSQIDMMKEKELRMELNKAVVEIIAIKQEEWKTRKSFLITEDSLNTANEIIDENINEISTLKEKIEELEKENGVVECWYCYKKHGTGHACSTCGREGR